MRLKYWPTLLSLFFFAYSFGQSYAPVSAIKDPPLFTGQLSHTASLLHQPLHEVRVLVYGQSISAQQWWMDVKAYFQKQYPSAVIVFANKAIGGFSSERLKLMVANDVISFYPDLILFHDYGSETDYEKIIQIIKEKTTADIAIQTDHVASQNQEWHDHHSNVWLPELCRKYGLALLDVRKYWKQYLQENDLQIKDLLTDGVHLNAQGNYLMAAIIKRYFDNLKPGNKSSNRITTIKWGKLNSKDGYIRMAFNGNRVDVHTNGIRTNAPIYILVDGKPSKEDVNCLYNTRPSLQPDGFFLTHIGLLLAMDFTGKTIEEDWSMVINSVDSVEQKIGYTIKGSLTGEDGTGSSNVLFTSRSGRIIIKPEAWFTRKSKGDFAQFNWLKPGDVLKWQIKSMCKDVVRLQPSSTQTILQGIKNGTHQLEIKGTGAKNVKNIFVYTPSLPED